MVYLFAIVYYFGLFAVSILGAAAVYLLHCLVNEK